MIVLLTLCGFSSFCQGCVREVCFETKRQTAEKNVGNRRCCPQLAILRFFSAMVCLKNKKTKHFSLGGNQFCLIPAFPTRRVISALPMSKLAFYAHYFLIFYISKFCVRYNLLIKILQVASFDSKMMEFLSPFFQSLFRHFGRPSQGDIKLSLFGLAHHSSSRSHMQRGRVSLLFFISLSASHAPRGADNSSAIHHCCTTF